MLDRVNRIHARMRLRRLRIHGLRCLQHVDIEPSPSLNLLCGSNGSGKTSVLESIYILGHGRSFRSRLTRDVITRGEERLVVYAEILDTGDGRRSIGVERGADGGRIRVDGNEVRAASSLAHALPLLLVTPESQRLLTDGARLRRRMLDWILFHVEPGYHAILQQYRKALRQRNAALRRYPTEVGVWSRELGNAGTRVHQYREEYCRRVEPHIRALVLALLDRETLVRYRCGWDRAKALVEVLERGGNDEERGFTQAGPHRADLEFEVDGVSAEQALSRGESKLFVAAVLLAQVRYLNSLGGSTPVVLVDDIASELDRKNRDKLLEVLRLTGAQIFATSVELRREDHEGWGGHKVFHVEQGTVEEMI